ncbi:MULTISPECIES: hypothetical protein [unclassified Lysinibacillus]|uniref:hypothetical protein n=1 Tax=unclassified Lysinibacillus TaxID=2636778 RepID=UPI003828E51A
MTVVGGNLERKEIGLPIGVSGTHNNTEINKSTGHLQLMQVDVDGQGNPVYTEQGSWTSDVVDLGDKFKDFEKVFTTNTNIGASSFAVLTRVSDNNRDWSDWTAIAMDGAIQSDTKQFIQIRIDLFAGFVTDEFIITKSDFEVNPFVEEIQATAGGYIVPTLTSNTSASTTHGIAFAETEYHTGNYPAWRAFDNVDQPEGYITKNGILSGYLGFVFNSAIKINRYKVRSIGQANILPYMIKDWVLEGSFDTTDGHDGKWIELDKRIHTFTTINTDAICDFNNSQSYKGYRIKWETNNSGSSYSEVGALNFYKESTTALRLKRDYAFDMKLDSTWSDTGSLHRKKITRDDWIKIDSLNPIFKEGV